MFGKISKWILNIFLTSQSIFSVTVVELNFCCIIDKKMLHKCTSIGSNEIEWTWFTSVPASANLQQDIPNKQSHPCYSRISPGLSTRRCKRPTSSCEWSPRRFAANLPGNLMLREISRWGWFRWQFGWFSPFFSIYICNPLPIWVFWWFLNAR